MSKIITVTDPNSEWFGMKFKMTMLYYDHKHTGDSEHLVYCSDDAGNNYRFFHTQVEGWK